jgi:predicted MFS family arabinose efflux permease
MAIFGVSALGVIGSIIFLLLPMLIGAFTEKLMLSPLQVGWLGSADMIGMFVAAVIAMFWIRSANWRLMATLAGGLLIACHLISGFTQDFVPLFVVRILAGFAGGSLMSIALTSLGDTLRPDRWFALFVAGQLSLGSLGLWLFPDFLAQAGLRGVFVSLATIVAVSMLLIPFISRKGSDMGVANRPTGQSRRSSVFATPGLFALLACFLFNLGIMAVWAYLERMGDSAGLDAGFVGQTLAFSLLGALIGALLAAAMADRFGRIKPIMINLAIQAIALLLLGGALTENSFLAGVMLFAFAWNFPVAYQLAITVSIDASGRLVVLFLSAVKLGYACAPIIAAQLMVLVKGYKPTILLAAFCFVGSAFIFIALARLAQSGNAITSE